MSTIDFLIIDNSSDSIFFFFFHPLVNILSNLGTLESRSLYLNDFDLSLFVYLVYFLDTFSALLKRLTAKWRNGSFIGWTKKNNLKNNLRNIYITHKEKMNVDIIMLIDLYNIINII